VIVVSDTSPLNYLLLIQAIDVLPQLFREVLVPTAVVMELSNSKAPAIVR
jgi:predicted nucleic acid-binding protein